MSVTPEKEETVTLVENVLKRPEEVKYEWEIITGDFFESIKELKLGELIHHDLFGLFEAMSAIEMMDPKMDAGMCCNKETIPLTFTTAVEKGVLKLVNLEYSELIGVFDGIFSCLVSWLEGHSLAQTLLTSLYLHHPELILDKYMKSFVCGIHKLINIIRKFITNARVFVEEDFQPSTYGYNISNELSDTKVIAMLKESEEDLIKKSKLVDSGIEDIQAVTCRLRFTRLFLQSLISLFPSKNISPNEIEMQEILKILNGLSELIPNIRKTIDKGTQPKENSDTPNPMGFSPMVNQRLLPPTFPRYTKIKDRLSSIIYFEEFIQRLKLGCKVIHCNSYHSALNFFMEFSKKSGPCLLSRSIVQSLYLPVTTKVFGVIEITEVLKESARSFIAPPVLMPKNPLYNNTQAKDWVDSFFFYNEQTFVAFLDICGYNRARQRDKLVRLLDSFANLQDDAENLDAYLHSLTMRDEAPRQHHLACFGTWVLYHCLRAMSLFLLSGLELELYSVHEYLYIFWYLYEFLFGWVVSALTRADAFLQEQECDQQKNSSGKNQRKSKIKKRKVKPYNREIMFNQAMQNMCGGYYKGFAGFLKEDRIPQPLSIFDNEKVRYDHRFAPFAELTTPPPIPYIEFKKVKNFLLKSSSSDLFLAGAKHFHQARTILESIANPDPEMNDILRVAKVNFVLMNLLANGHKKDSKKSPEFDFSIHRYFPIIKQL